MASPTRLSTNIKLIALVGPGKEFVPSEVPSLRAVIQRGILLQQDNLQSRRNYPIKDMAKDLAQLILDQWQLSNDDFQKTVTKNEKTNADIIVKNGKP